MTRDDMMLVERTLERRLQEILAIAEQLKIAENLEPTHDLAASYGNLKAMANQFGRQLEARVSMLKGDLRNIEVKTSGKRYQVRNISQDESEVWDTAENLAGRYKFIGPNVYHAFKADGRPLGTFNDQPDAKAEIIKEYEGR